MSKESSRRRKDSVRTVEVATNGQASRDKVWTQRLGSEYPHAALITVDDSQGRKTDRSKNSPNESEVGPVIQRIEIGECRRA